MNEALALAGQRAVTEATRMWNLDIIDPPHGSTNKRAADSLVVINEIIVANGWGGNVKYTGNGPPQWCGMFAGKCWREAGLDPSWLATYFASTFRLGLWARYQRFAPTSKANPAPGDVSDRRVIVRLMRGVPLQLAPQAGDIVIAGDGEPIDGDHVTVCVAYDAARRTFDTISGNGGGLGPHGDHREGISRHEFAIDAATGYRAMWLVRPAFGDLLAEKPAQ